MGNQPEFDDPRLNDIRSYWLQLCSCDLEKALQLGRKHQSLPDRGKADGNTPLRLPQSQPDPPAGLVMDYSPGESESESEKL
jgi:hypothetical protein